ncbi:MAG: thiamine-phosphate kinase [Bacteroidaceae bacterium]|nr:thiamine-phosphate kinase [Bacteroidaceae bacterium]
MEIAELGEFGLIRHLTENIEIKNRETLKGVGDDCAVMDYGGERLNLITTDLLLEGVHFDLQYVPLKHLGYKAAMVNLSDIYAMNGRPRQMTVSLGVSKRFSVEDLEDIYSGLRLACEACQCDIVGGDTSASMTGLTISITVVGDVARDMVTYRNGAKENDIICVSGDLGAAYMGLQLLEREKAIYNSQLAEAQQQGKKIDTLPQFQPDFSGREYLLERQLKPEARKDIIEALAAAGIKPTSMMDISDGLSSELMHICNQSKAGCRVYEERIPLDYQTAAAAEEMNMNVTTCAMNGGEDYELLFTIPLSMNDAIQSIPGVKAIGYITAAKDGQWLICRDGTEMELKAQGWNPLKES